MDIILYALLGALIAILVMLIATWFIMRKARREVRALASRVYKLPLHYKIALATGLMRDERIPTGLRLLPPLLILYLALPLDLIPDFIPVIGQVDDILVLMVGGALLAWSFLGRLAARGAGLRNRTRVHDRGDGPDRLDGSDRLDRPRGDRSDRGDRQHRACDRHDRGRRDLHRR